jgi:hypothetical protein
MIENDVQYALTKKWCENFEVEIFRQKLENKDDPFNEISLAAMQSQLNELKEEMRVYENNGRKSL